MKPRRLSQVLFRDPIHSYDEKNNDTISQGVRNPRAGAYTLLLDEEGVHVTGRRGRTVVVPRSNVVFWEELEPQKEQSK